MARPPAALAFASCSHVDDELLENFLRVLGREIRTLMFDRSAWTDDQ